MAERASKKPKYKIPDEFESEDEFLCHIRETFQQDYDADRDNIDAALDDFRFAAGEQWDDDVKLQRLRNGKPCMTINRLPQFVGQVIGDMRVNRPSIKFRPAEDADKDLADIRAGLVRAIEHASSAMGVYIQAGEDQVTGGIGNFRVNLEYVDDDVFDQDIRIRSIANPLGVVWDAMSVERTGGDANHCFIIDEAPRKPFEKRYPRARTGDLGDVLSSTAWATRDTIRVVEYWRMKETEREIALLNDGSIKDITDRQAEFADHISLTDDGKPRVRKVMRKSACMWVVTGNAIIEGPYELPINRLPVFRVQGREVRIGTRRVRFGLVRFAKDAQRLMNYWRSVIAETLALAPKAQWLIKRTTDGEIEDEFREAHRSGDSVLTWDGESQPERIDPPPFPEALLRQAALNAQDMKDVTGLHDASLGVQSNETSGKAILARQREGDVAVAMYHDNLNAAIQAAGDVINQLIPVCYDTARTIRVIGEDETAKLQRINDPNDPDSVDLGKGKYDIVVETGPSYSTKRAEAAESMVAFIQAVPTAAGVIGDLVAKAMDWEDSEAIADRLKKMLPPQLQDAQEGEVSPEQQQAREQAMQAQQQAQAMAQRAAELELTAKEADTEKAKAEAVEARADAMKAQAEAIEAHMKVVSSDTAQVIEAVFGPGAADAFLAAFASMQTTQQAIEGAQQMGRQMQQPPPGAQAA